MTIARIPFWKGLGDVLGGLAPYLAGQEQRVAVLPLPRGVVRVGVRCDAEPGDRLPRTG